MSKFISNPCWVGKFLTENNNVDLTHYNLLTNKSEFLMKFNSKESIEEYILSLSENNKKILSRLFSNWRKNGVYNKISQIELIREKNQFFYWTILDIPLTQLYVSQTEPGLKNLFERHFGLSLLFVGFTILITNKNLYQIRCM